MSYQLIFLPLIAAIVAQIIKMIINGLKGQFSWYDLNSYGGMPSSHGALVTALALTIGYFEGWSSASFSISLILAILVIRDAGGFRKTLGNHAEELNNIIHTLNPVEASKYPHLKERLGHTPLELFFGALTGVVIVVLYVFIF